MFCFSLLSIFYFSLSTGNLSVEIQNIDSANGNIMLAVFEKEQDFLIDERAIFAKAYSIPQKGSMLISIPALPFGKYAIAVYHDANNNQELDKNMFGVPKEAYGFSNNVRSKWRAPQYKEAQINFSTDQQKLIIPLKQWSKQ
jgi:uncharacterized protein (DUF2141 family)